MKWKADTNAENMGVEEVRPRRPRFVIGYGNHRLCRWRHPVKALALSIKRSELQVEVLIKELATSRTEIACLRAVGQKMQVK